MMRIRDDMDSLDNIYFLEGHSNVIGHHILTYVPQNVDTVYLPQNVCLRLEFIHAIRMIHNTIMFNTRGNNFHFM